MPVVDDFDALINAKILYIKLISIVDKEKYKDKPIFKRTLRRSGETFDVYDLATYYQFTHFAENKPRDHEWKFTSSEGQVDALQLHPFDPTTSDPDPAKKTIHQSVMGNLRPTPDTLLVVCHYYNGFQRESGEWVGVRAANDTKLLRLVVDFSSIMTVKGEELFKTQPVSYLSQKLKKDPNNPSKNLETKLKFEFNDGKVFSASKENVIKGDVIFIKYKMNWDSLYSWQAYHEDKQFVPEFLFS